MEQGVNDEGGMCKSEEAINIYPPAVQTGCPACPGDVLSGWAAGEPPTGECRPPERPDGGSELESTYWVCGTAGGEGKKTSV